MSAADDVRDRLGSALDFTMTRFLDINADLVIARRKIAAVEALVTRARLVSPSDTMTLYVRDVENALGLTATASPHKLGSVG